MAVKLNQLQTGMIGALAVAIILLTLWAVTPAKLHPIGVTIWFLVLFTAIAALLALSLDFFKRIFGPKKPTGRQFGPSLRQGMLLSLWLVMLVALSSLRQLTLRDAILIGLLIVIVEFYLRLAT